MRRREFVVALASAAAGWPPPVRAQRGEHVRLIGALLAPAENDTQGQAVATALRDGLRERGWTEGRNLQIVWRWAGGDIVHFRDYATELVELAPELIFAVGTSSVATLKQATRSIPIIFAIVNDPVAQGFIPSMGHPGGNITGFSFLEYSQVGKSLELLKQVAPDVIRIAVMFNPETYPYYNVFLRSFERTARSITVELVPAEIRTRAEIDGTIAKLGEHGGAGLLSAPDPFTSVHRDAIITSTARHRVPAIYAFLQYVQEGGLMSYGADPVDIVRRAGSYVDLILKGANPGDLPAQQPTKFEFAVNLRTAHALDLTVPKELLAAADEIVE